MKPLLRFMLLLSLFCASPSHTMDQAGRQLPSYSEIKAMLHGPQSDGELEDLVRGMHAHNLNVASLIISTVGEKKRRAVEKVKTESNISDKELQQIDWQLHSLRQKRCASLPYPRHTYLCSPHLKSALRIICNLVEDPRYNWPQNLTVYYGFGGPSTIASAENTGLYLPESFLLQSHCYQRLCLAHECVHLHYQHGEERALIAQQIQLKKMLAPMESVLSEMSMRTQQQHNPQKRSYFRTILPPQILRAQEYQADWFSLFVESPLCVEEGIKHLPKPLSPTTHPSPRNRQAWLTLFIRLLKVEQRIT